MRGQDSGLGLGLDICFETNSIRGSNSIDGVCDLGLRLGLGSRACMSLCTPSMLGEWYPGTTSRVSTHISQKQASLGQRCVLGLATGATDHGKAWIRCQAMATEVGCSWATGLDWVTLETHTHTHTSFLRELLPTTSRSIFYSRVGQIAIFSHCQS